MARLLAAGGGFLLAVLWMDLMFDVQARSLGFDAARDAEALRSIAGYYRRVTTDAFPMNRLIGAVMLATVAASVVDAIRRPRPRQGSRRRAGGAVLLAGVPIGLALTRVLPNAVRLGSAADAPAVQAALAGAILRDHLACVASVAAFTALQLWPRRDEG